MDSVRLIKACKVEYFVWSQIGENEECHIFQEKYKVECVLAFQ